MTFYANGSPIIISPDQIKRVVSDGCVDIIVVDDSIIPSAIKEHLLHKASEAAGFTDESSIDKGLPIYSVNLEESNTALSVFLPATQSTFDGDADVTLTRNQNC